MSSELVQAQPEDPPEEADIAAHSPQGARIMLQEASCFVDVLGSMGGQRLLVLRLVVRTHPWGLACASGEQAVSFLEKAAACGALR